MKENVFIHHYSPKGKEMNKKVECLVKEIRAENSQNRGEVWTSKFMKLIDHSKIQDQNDLL